MGAPARLLLGGDPSRFQSIFGASVLEWLQKLVRLETEHCRQPLDVVERYVAGSPLDVPNKRPM